MEFLGVNMMVRITAIVLIIFGILVIGYSSLQLYHSHTMEKKRLDEAKDLISEEVIKDDNDIPAINYDWIQEGDTIGVFYIPRLDREIPIIAGVEEEELAQGIGHYTGTGYPGENRQILLSGHRDTVFRHFDELKDGDELHIKMDNGTFIYEISDHKIVDANDTTVINLDQTEEVLTVSTCYPFSYIGNAPDRYVLYAYPKK